MSDPAIRLWFGRTVHRREAPFVRTFSHAIAMIDVDIDRLREADGSARLFSVHAANAFAFRQTDHGARRADIPLRTWAEALYGEAGVFLDGGQIRLISFPRVLGHGFAPIRSGWGMGPKATCAERSTRSTTRLGKPMHMFLPARECAMYRTRNSSFHPSSRSAANTGSPCGHPQKDWSWSSKISGPTDEIMSPA